MLMRISVLLLTYYKIKNEIAFELSINALTVGPQAHESQWTAPLVTYFLSLI